MLVTRCSNCHTIFRLTDDAQLRLHKGDVRCGQCQQVFDGYSTLIVVPENCMQPATATAMDIVPSVAPLSAPIDQFDAHPQLSTAKNFWPWLVVNMLLLMMLFGQLAYVYRTELFVALPAARPILNKYCDLLQCEVDMPRHLQLFSLESSDLRAIPYDSAVVEFSAIIRNHAAFPQALPALLLTLTDADEQPLASRIFTADDYQAPGADNQSVLMAGSEIHIQRFLGIRQLDVVGYKLELFYP